ncbi:PREDICTED: serine/threonine-protein kinase rio2-like [Ipomoea nil]|uniref:serine/threonine-protein kinase rio2-like n=1 Tax=Ipomoea nil TaxID=35883 RepID=UPI000901EF65|nr:PREDICTED: serine/threonine-protein kinase rio2-like [Ipomoea nil]
MDPVTEAELKQLRYIMPAYPKLKPKMAEDHPRDPKGSASGTKDVHGNEIEERMKKKMKTITNDDETEDDNSGTDDTDDDDNDDNNNQQGGESAEEEEPEDSHTILQPNLPHDKTLKQLVKRVSDLEESSNKVARQQHEIKHSHYSLKERVDLACTKIDTYQDNSYQLGEYALQILGYAQDILLAISQIPSVPPTACADDAKKGEK